MTDPANRGKKAEADVTAFLKTWDTNHHDFDWARNYDAHSAGGRFARQTGDYQFYTAGKHGVIEVKEVKHDIRLPHGNFVENSVAKCRKRELAGGIIIIVVRHSTTGLWRLCDFQQFLTREGGSWVLIGNTYKGAREALTMTEVFG